MRRPMRLGLAIVIALLLLGGAYSAFWLIAAGRIADGVAMWAQSLRAEHLDLSWRAIRVGGYPLAFRLELADAAVRDERPASIGEVRLPLLTASTAPWNFHSWQLDAPDGLRALTGPAERPVATLTARQATGSIVAGSDGGATLWFRVGEASAEAGLHLAARDVLLWLILPPHPPQTHTERGIGLALDVHELTLPQVPTPLRNPLDEIAFGATLMGAIPMAPARQAAAAWRDSGGTLELDHLALRWGGLAITGSGTVALDRNLQPIGALSGAIEGYGELMSALVAAGRMRASDARLAQLGLAMLAKTGPDGRPQIGASFTIQNGEMYLGPARLGPAPRISWE